LTFSLPASSSRPIADLVSFRVSFSCFFVVAMRVRVTALRDFLAAAEARAGSEADPTSSGYFGRRRKASQPSAFTRKQQHSGGASDDDYTRKPLAGKLLQTERSLPLELI
jgi:hypothetical protein